MTNLVLLAKHLGFLFTDTLEFHGRTKTKVNNPDAKSYSYSVRLCYVVERIYSVAYLEPTYCF